MIEEQGRVRAVEGRWAIIEPMATSACQSCSAHAGCGTSSLGRFLGARRAPFRALNTVGARPGELVRIGIDEGRLGRVSILMYLWPLLAMIGGAMLFRQLGWPAGTSPDFQALAGGIPGLLLALLSVRWYARRYGARFHPVVTAVLRQGDETVVTLHPTQG
ncbi:MAG: transcriptional regulator [Gammaproteobacteria bacterium]|nr:MAG: transcriptional regulator [Gammaproteobacteria bacterium]